MKNTPDQIQTGSALEKANDNTIKFLGTDNPRHIRAIDALMKKPRHRKQLDAIAGCSNTPELIAELRRRGLGIPCERITVLDRDGKLSRPGIYYILNDDRRKIIVWRNLHTSNAGGS